SFWWLLGEAGGPGGGELNPSPAGARPFTETGFQTGESPACDSASRCLAGRRVQRDGLRPVAALPSRVTTMAPIEFIFRMLLAAGPGAPLRLQRETPHKPAGGRTTMPIPPPAAPSSVESPSS